MRKVSGKKYAEVDEKYEKKMRKKKERKMDTAGIATALKESVKNMGYSKQPGVKPQKKK